MKLRRVVLALLPLMMVHPSSPAAARLSLVDWNSYNYHEPSGPGTYSFGYDVEDPAADNVQFRNEERHPNGTVTGSYGYVDPEGNVRLFHYIADHRGYRVREENPLQLSMLKPIIHPDTPFYTPSFPENDFNRRSTFGYPPYRTYFPRK